jgi:hypothetical protein
MSTITELLLQNKIEELTEHRRGHIDALREVRLLQTKALKADLLLEQAYQVLLAHGVETSCDDRRAQMMDDINQYLQTIGNGEGTP